MYTTKWTLLTSYSYIKYNINTTYNTIIPQVRTNNNIN